MIDLEVHREGLDHARQQLAGERDEIDRKLRLLDQLDALYDELNPTPPEHRPASRAKTDEAKRIYGKAFTEPPRVDTATKVIVATPAPKIGKRTVKKAECPDCHEVLGSAQGLASHRKKFHATQPVAVNEGGAIAPAVPVVDRRQSYFCEGCNDRFDDAELCAAHEAECDQVAKIRAPRHECPECDELFGSAAGLGSHRKHKHAVPSAAVVARGDAHLPVLTGAKAPVQQLSGELALRCTEAGCTFDCRSSIDMESHARGTHGRRSLPGERTPVAV